MILCLNLELNLSKRLEYGNNLLKQSKSDWKIDRQQFNITYSKTNKMKFITKTIILFFSVVFYWTSQAQQNNDISIHFKGKQFDKLNLAIFLPEKQADGLYKRTVIMGNSENSADWKFSFPDSLYDRHMFCRLQIPTESDTIVETIGFLSVAVNDTLLSGEFCFSKGNSSVDAVYFSSSTFRNLFAGPNHTALFKTEKQNRFIISPQSDKQLLASTEAMGIGYSMPIRLDTLAYPKQLTEYENLTRKYPESHYLIHFFNSNLTAFQSKADIQRIFNCFSPENQESYYGRLTSDFLASKNTQFDYSVFENSTLPVWNSDKSEPIVNDTTKFNLVVFSASWCAPCHALIPKLRKVYDDFKDHLVMTYISMDEESTVKNWNQLMQKENIPWRSLFAKDCMKKVQEKYHAQAIPHTILVYPGGIKAEILDIRLDKDLRKLAGLVR